MQDSRILSTFQDLAPSPAPAAMARAADGPAKGSPLETCQVGVVLRVVLFVQAIVAVLALFAAPDLGGWVAQQAMLTGATLPATLLWLVMACASRRLLGSWPLARQVALGVALGAIAGLYGCGMLHWTGLIDPAPWLASAASGMLVASVVLAGLVWRMRARTPAGTAARLAELQARIRPHFLFNTLNSAIALVRAEPAKAERLLEDLSELFRHALADTRESVTLAQELALARHYLAIEEVRFGERLQVEWQLDPAADAARLPPLILQPLVENAVKHGVEPSPSGATVRISTQRRNGVVVIKVTNTTPAGTGEPGHGLALDNVRQRLALLHDVQGQFQSALIDGVYQVRLEIPL